MLQATAVITLIVQLLLVSAAEIPHVTPNQLLEWPDEAYEYYFVVSESAPDCKLVFKCAVSLNPVQM